LGWSPYEYYTSSPQDFYYACKGYFDKENNLMMLMRNVAMFASQRASDEFNKYWPAEGSTPDKKTWGTKEDAAELRKQIEKAHGIKLS
jgi:hypothetical protein